MAEQNGADGKVTEGPARKGRGALANVGVRFDRLSREALDDGWADDDLELSAISTEVRPETARSIISRNDSPDIPFRQSINPYRGCEHGCIYCYARPSHAYLGLSPGLDFESRLSAKINAAELLRRELLQPGYRCSPIALGANTDPYQPVEREWRLTRGILEVLAACDHPVTIVTKSALVERDLDVLAPMARKGLVEVYISISTLDGKLARRMDPRAASPQRRLEAMGRLRDAGVPAGVLVAPVIPALNDSDMEKILQAAREAGASGAAYVLLRLPMEVADLFESWLEAHYPLKAPHVMSLLQQSRADRNNDPAFGTRMRGTGVFADMLEQRFRLAIARLGLNRREGRLDASLFRPSALRGQMSLF